MAFPKTLDRDDPVDFARHLYSEVAELFQDELIVHAPRALAAYRREFAATKRLHGGEIPYDHPLMLMDEKAHDWSTEAFWDGVAFGVAVADLRRALGAMHDATVCRSCGGDGDRAEPPCRRCQGRGFVPTEVAA